MSQVDPYVRSTYARARRRELSRRVARILQRRRRSEELLSLDEVNRRLRPFEQSYVGVRAIPVARIVGSVGRSADFDRDFLPRRPETESRWRRVERAYAAGDFPPISVYEVDGSYFVVDGHHRVAIARQRGVEFIDAEITRLRTRVALPANADVGRLIMAEQERLFMEESGLDRARPEARIRFSNPTDYVELMEHVKMHGFDRMLGQGKVSSRDEIGADWYDHVYMPIVEAIHRERLHELWPKATDAELFLWVSRRRRELFPERGSIPHDEAVRVAGEIHRRRRVRTRMRRRREALRRRMRRAS